jgi:hypothetical protein
MVIAIPRASLLCRMCCPLNSGGQRRPLPKISSDRPLVGWLIA